MLGNTFLRQRRDHGAQSGLGDDDHTIYLLVSGARAGTGAWTNAGSLTSQIDGLTTTSALGLIATNTTAAAAGAQQWSPPVRWSSAGWKTDATAASQIVDWHAQAVPIQGAAAPTGEWRLSSQVNGGGYTTRVTVTTGGAMTVAPDTDTVHDFGRNRLGQTGGDRASFGHIDSTGSTLCLTHHSGGNNFITELNTASNGEVRVQTAGADRFVVDATGSRVVDALERSVTTGITASTTQTQAGGVALTKDINNVTTVANANDAVTMPTAKVGKTVLVMNNAATNTVQLFPFSGDNFQGVAANLSTTIAAGNQRWFYAIDAVTWVSSAATAIATT